MLGLFNSSLTEVAYKAMSTVHQFNPVVNNPVSVLSLELVNTMIELPLSSSDILFVKLQLLSQSWLGTLGSLALLCYLFNAPLAFELLLKLLIDSELDVWISKLSAEGTNKPAVDVSIHLFNTVHAEDMATGKSHWFVHLLKAHWALVIKLLIVGQVLL